MHGKLEKPEVSLLVRLHLPQTGLLIRNCVGDDGLPERRTTVSIFHSHFWTQGWGLESDYIPKTHSSRDVMEVLSRLTNQKTLKSMTTKSKILK